MNRKPTEHGETVRAEIMKYLQAEEKLVVPVSIREIQDKIGISSLSVVNWHLEKLERQGKIKRHQGQSRFIQLVKDEKTISKPNRKTRNNET